MILRNAFLTVTLLLTLIGVGLPQQVTFAATLSAGDAAQLVSAITTANSTPEADTILLTNDIVLTAPAELSAAGNTGLPAITSNITIEGQDHIINRLGVAPDFRILRVASGATLTLMNVTISGGNLSTGTTSGGGILNAGTLNVTHSRILNNHSTNGGGILNSGGVATITNSTISGNSTTSPTSMAPGGGGISNATGTLTVESSLIWDNTTSKNGAGILSTSGTVNIHNTTIDGNTNAADGGGIYANGATLTVSGSTFTNNQAVNGGGIYIATGNATISNTTLGGNTANFGSGLDNNGTLTLLNSTIAANSGGSARGFINFGTLTVKNSIVAGFTVSGSLCSNNGTLTVDAFSLTDDLGCSTFINSPSLNFAPLADNGGPTQTFSILAGSSAYDAADNSVCEASPVNDFDQRGIQRGSNSTGQLNAPQPGDCEVGALETGQIRTLQFAESFSAVAPSALTLPVSLTLDRAAAGRYAPVTAYVWVSGGTAVAGVDYTPFGVQPVTFQSTEATQTINVTLLQPLATKTIILSLATEHGPGFSGPAQLGAILNHTLLTNPSPVNAAPPRNLFTTATPTLTWTPLSWAVGYELEVADNTAFNTPQTYETTQPQLVTDSLTNGIYYWRVRGKRANGTLGTWSIMETFKVLIP